MMLRELEDEDDEEEEEEEDDELDEGMVLDYEESPREEREMQNDAERSSRACGKDPPYVERCCLKYIGRIGKRHELHELGGWADKVLIWRPEKATKADSDDRIWPLILYLHCANCRGTIPSRIFEYGQGTPPKLLDDGDLSLEAVVVSPLLDAGQEWAKNMSQTSTLARIISALFSSTDLPHIDRNRVYCTGASCGGLGAFTMGCRLAARSVYSRPGAPDLPPFAAIAPVCGGGTKLFAKLLAATPCWFWHSEADAVVDSKDTEAIVDTLTKLNAPVKFTKLLSTETPPSPDYCASMTGHNAWTPAYEPSSPLWPWLLSQSLSVQEDDNDTNKMNTFFRLGHPDNEAKNPLIMLRPDDYNDHLHHDHENDSSPPPISPDDRHSAQRHRSFFDPDFYDHHTPIGNHHDSTGMHTGEQATSNRFLDRDLDDDQDASTPLYATQSGASPSTNRLRSREDDDHDNYLNLCAAFDRRRRPSTTFISDDADAEDDDNEEEDS